MNSSRKPFLVIIGGQGLLPDGGGGLGLLPGSGGGSGAGGGLLGGGGLARVRLGVAALQTGDQLALAD